MSKDATDVKDKPKKKVVETEVQLDEAALKALAKEVGTAVLPELRSQLSEDNKKVLDEFIAKMDKPKIKKGIKGGKDKDAGEEGDDPIAKGIKAGLFHEKIAKMSPAMRFYRASKALAEENWGVLKQFNHYAIASRQKAGYANVGVAADGSVLVPDAEFDTNVYDNLPKYSVALADADVRQTDRTSVRVISLDSGLQFYSTAEAAQKTSAKMTFSKNERSLTKYAVIVPATDELTEDAAIDFWNLVTRELGRAYAKLADEITFTNATTGITNTTGIITEATSGAGTTVTWDDLLSAESKVEPEDINGSNYKWYMRKETWFRLIMLKGSTNDHYLTGSLNTNGWVANPNQPTTPWGTPVVFTRVLPSSGATAGSPGVVGSNDAFAVYGDLRNYILYTKRGMQLKLLTEATIQDSEGTDLDLAAQDATAMRAVVRILGILPKGNASKFVVLGTGTVS